MARRAMAREKENADKNQPDDCTSLPGWSIIKNNAPKKGRENAQSSDKPYIATVKSRKAVLWR